MGQWTFRRQSLSSLCQKSGDLPDWITGATEFGALGRGGGADNKVADDALCEGVFFHQIQYADRPRDGGFVQAQRERQNRQPRRSGQMALYRFERVMVRLAQCALVRMRILNEIGR